MRHRPRRRQQQQRQRRGGEKSRFKGQKAPKGVIARPRGRRARSSTPGSSRGRRGTGRRRCSGPRSPPSGVVVRPSPLCVSFQHKTSFNVLLRALVSLSLSRRGPPAWLACESLARHGFALSFPPLPGLRPTRGMTGRRGRAGWPNCALPCNLRLSFERERLSESCRPRPPRVTAVRGATPCKISGRI